MFSHNMLCSSTFFTLVIYGIEQSVNADKSSSQLDWATAIVAQVASFRGVQPCTLT